MFYYYSILKGTVEAQTLLVSNKIDKSVYNIYIIYNILCILYKWITLRVYTFVII